MMHRHLWKIIDKQVLPSAWEQMDDSDEYSVKAWGNFAQGMFDKPVIVSYRCEHCGKEKIERQ